VGSGGWEGEQSDDGNGHDDRERDAKGPALADEQDGAGGARREDSEAEAPGDGDHGERDRNLEGEQHAVAEVARHTALRVVSVGSL
jgi:hypothetical protein